jgi:hypothetical protein
MPTARKLIAGLALALTAISCSDKSDVTAPSQPLSAPTAPQVRQPLIFSGVQTFTDPAGLVQGTFTNTVQVTQFHYSEAGQLTVDGRIIWKDANGTVVNTQDFTGWAATLTGSGGPTSASCSILVLDIGAVHLDLLGLVVDLAPVHLNITAQSGSGNLLGNLLCAVANLLNGPNLGGLFTAITNLLNQINLLLAGL